MSPTYLKSSTGIPSNGNINKSKSFFVTSDHNSNQLLFWSNVFPSNHFPQPSFIHSRHNGYFTILQTGKSMSPIQDLYFIFSAEMLFSQIFITVCRVSLLFPLKVTFWVAVADQFKATPNTHAHTPWPLTVKIYLLFCNSSQNLSSHFLVMRFNLFLVFYIFCVSSVRIRIFYILLSTTH